MSVEVDALMPEIEAADTAPELPEVEVTTDPPADKPAVARDESGKFVAKEGEKKPPEVKEEPKAEVKTEQKTIPLASHLEERRALKAEMEAMKRELEALKNPPKPPEPIADDQVKPTLQTALEKLKALEEKTTTVEKTAQESSEQTQLQTFLTDLASQEQVFLKENPDYFDALEHMRKIAYAQMREFNPEATDEQIWQTVRQQEIGMALQLRRAGRNPIATAYNLAKTYGYQRKAPALELPKVEAPKTLAPDLTLGSGGATEADESEVKDPFAEAFGELFGRKKSA